MEIMRQGCRLKLGVEGAGDNLILLFLRELYKVHRVTAYAHGELRILLGMRLRIKESFLCKYIYIKVMSALFNIAVKQGDKVVLL